MSSAIVKGFFKFYPVIFHKKGIFSGKNPVFGGGRGGGIHASRRGRRPRPGFGFTYQRLDTMTEQRGDLPQGLPFGTPHGLGGQSPETPDYCEAK